MPCMPFYLVDKRKEPISRNTIHGLEMHFDCVLFSEAPDFYMKP